jgi:tetratricopeptide (TPR) repeat protein
LVNGRSQAEIDYYRLHDLAYSYARAMFISRGLSQQPVIDACHTYTTNHIDDLAALDVEQSNILEAAEAAHQAGRDAILVDMMRSLTVDGPFFAARGHTSLSLQLLKTAIDAALDGEQPETAHYLLSKLGNTYADFTGDLETALDSYQKALELAREIADSRREAILLTVIGTVRFRQGADDTDNYHQQAEQIARSSDDEFALCQVLHNRGAQALLDKEHPDYDRGRQLSDEAASLAARHGLSHLHFHSLVNRGGCEYELGQVEQALKTHQEAFDLAQAQGNHPWKAYALRSIGEDYHALDNRTEAQKAFDEALTLWRQSGGKAQIADLTVFMEARNYMIKSE